ncbi:hypothetical protein ACJIZ3_020612 [Penstemon smallii]|uniref:F-box domain-containing protein n=1 Tax=Penstemon smallii TaxID=265156 RepID=A0ABD3SJQ7_9LAMI
MSEIPPDLYPDVLSRVLAESLLRFRCVCKAWRRIIDDPSFIKLHLHRRSDSGQLILSNDIGTKHCTLSLGSLNCYSSEAPTEKVVFPSPLLSLIRDVILSPLIRGDVPLTFPLASCNGLILISKSIEDEWAALWNPFTRETHVLPSYTNTTIWSNKLVRSSHIAFGYDYVTDDYKVVKILEYYYQTAHGYRAETLVYSLKSNSWRSVKDCPYLPWLHVPGVFVNGALHWISAMSGNQDELMIVAFDLATEDYYTLPLPPAISKQRRRSPWILDALGECLLVTWKDSVYHLDDYGGKNMWTKLFSFSSIGLGDFRPIAYLKTKGEFFLKGDEDEYFWVNTEKKSAKKVRIDGVQCCRFSQICLASLVRLK